MIMKTTKATIKSFIRKNTENLYINVKSEFDGMTDMCESQKGGFGKATMTDEYRNNRLGISGAWFVGNSRDYFSDYDDGVFAGYEVYNCCGKFILAVKK